MTYGKVVVCKHPPSKKIQSQASDILGGHFTWQWDESAAENMCSCNKSAAGRWPCYISGVNTVTWSLYRAESSLWYLSEVKNRGGKVTEGQKGSMWVSVTEQKEFMGWACLPLWVTCHDIPTQLWTKDQCYSLFVRTEWDSITQLKMQHHSSSCFSDELKELTVTPRRRGKKIPQSLNSFSIYSGRTFA